MAVGLEDVKDEGDAYGRFVVYELRQHVGGC